MIWAWLVRQAEPVVPSSSPDIGVWVALIGGVVTVLITLIGSVTAYISKKAGTEAVSSSKEAKKAATEAQDYAAALEAKNALIVAQGEQIDYLERTEKACRRRLDALEENYGELLIAQQASALVEKANAEKIRELEARIVE